MPYYHEIITEKSWKTLCELKRQFKFILIGGWTVFLYTRALKSKDIDLICEYEELEKFKQKYELFKNERLKKYEIKIEETDIDIYLPFYSNLTLPVEEIKNYTEEREGFRVPRLEILLILKQGAYKDRKGTPKGEKDKIDIVSILKSKEIDLDFYLKMLDKYNLVEYRQELIKLLKNIKEMLELNLNAHQISRLKKQILEKLE